MGLPVQLLHSAGIDVIDAGQFFQSRLRISQVQVGKGRLLANVVRVEPKGSSQGRFGDHPAKVARLDIGDKRTVVTPHAERRARE